ncbi:hypothetical protein N0V93_005935 [Gnomoniopsis smithogilvyi]|uniref:Uncharacterized protein n=1 Tax=Gnomoniopsis smithogilvyi TaxID=1191159 RepID=A0A9W8YVJ6_9PEZI|nr:hypothetical protein N0V93_005935 [Gnomoniopsis smithogilvyi]
MSLPMKRPRKRGASTSICLPEKGSSWVTVPQSDTQTSNKTNDETTSQDIVFDNGSSEREPLCKDASIDSSEARESASPITAMPKSSHDTSPLLPARCEHVSKPTEKLEQVRLKARNKALLEKLVQDHGIDRMQYPVSTNDAFHLDGPSRGILRISPVLGPINLHSPISAKALCLAAIADFDKTQTVLMDAWSPCCRVRDCIPPIQNLWNDLSNFSFAVHLFTALTVTRPSALKSEAPSTPTGHPRNWLQPEVRARYMTWRTPAQKRIHHRLDIAYDEDWAVSVDGGDDDDVRERYPLSGKQLMKLAHVCFKASDMLWPLIKALRELFLWQKRMVRAKTDAHWTMFYKRRREVHRCMGKCVRITRCPLVSWLRVARGEVCAALGMDAEKVPGGEDEGDDVMARGALLEEKPVEDQRDEKEIDEVVLEQGAIPRQARVRIALFKARYHFICLLSPRWSFDKLEELATNITLIMEQMEEEEEDMGNAIVSSKLNAIRQRIMRRVEKMEKTHHRKISLVDPITRKMIRPIVPKRAISGIKAGWAKVLGRHFLDGLDELFGALARFLGEKKSVG